jgi:hypothetical protein
MLYDGCRHDLGGVVKIGFWRRRQLSKEDLYTELNHLVATIEGDPLTAGARLYAENNGTLVVFGVSYQAKDGALLPAPWKRHFLVSGCPHCLILEWDKHNYPEKDVGRARYNHQVRSGSRPSIEVARGQAADRFPEVAIPESLAGQVRGSCDLHVVDV